MALCCALISNLVCHQCEKHHCDNDLRGALLEYWTSLRKEIAQIFEIGRKRNAEASRLRRKYLRLPMGAGPGQRTRPTGQARDSTVIIGTDLHPERSLSTSHSTIICTFGQNSQFIGCGARQHHVFFRTTHIHQVMLSAFLSSIRWLFFPRETDVQDFVDFDTHDLHSHSST